MNIQLIQGAFSSGDAIALITQMIQIKIKYHEDKINIHTNEEDIKFREAKIKHLQNELHALNKAFHSKSINVAVEAIINIK